jgi:hypothetical protein
LLHVVDTMCCGVRYPGVLKALRMQRRTLGVKDGDGKEFAKDGKWSRRMKRRWLAGRRGVSRRGDKLWALNHGRDHGPISSGSWQRSRLLGQAPAQRWKEAKECI